MAGNTTTKKQYSKIKSPSAGHTLAPKGANFPNEGGMAEGQMRGNAQPDKFAEVLNEVSAPIKGMDRTYDDIGEKSGFITDGYLDKQGTPYGEAAKLNLMPPGMDISNQEIAEIHQMPLRRLVSESYPGDGWMPAPRDIPE